MMTMLSLQLMHYLLLHSDAYYTHMYTCVSASPEYAFRICIAFACAAVCFAISLDIL